MMTEKADKHSKFQDELSNSSDRSLIEYSVEDSDKEGGRRLSRRVVIGFLSVALILAIGVAVSGMLLRRSVEATAKDALEGRALDLSLGVASTLSLLNPNKVEDIQAALALLAKKPILSLSLVRRDGSIITQKKTKTAIEKGDTNPAYVELPSKLFQGAEHAVEIITKEGDRPVYRIWLPMRALGGGLRLIRHWGWSRGRGRWRRWRAHQQMNKGRGKGRIQGFGTQAMGPSQGRGQGGPGRGLGPGRGRGRWLGPGSAWRGGMGGGPSGGLVQGNKNEKKNSLKRRGSGPFLAVEVEIDAPEIKRSVDRAVLTQWVSFGAAFALILISFLLFLAYRRAGNLEHQMIEQKRMAEMGEMGAVLAHEIRNPLGVIKGTAQILEEKADKSDERNKLNVLVDQTHRLERLVNGLLDYVRPRTLEKQKTDIRNLVEKACELLETEAVKKQVALLQDLEEVEATVDPDAIMQVLLNLLGNAIDMVERGGTVTTKLRLRAGKVTLIVLDDGKGIPEKLGSRIFKPFVTSKTGGTGLGLPLSRKIAEAHGGFLTAVNRPEKGAKFTMTIPIS